MKTNTTKLLIALVILIAIFLVVRYTGNKDRSKSFRSELVSIDTAEVTRVVFDRGTELRKEEGSWYVYENEEKHKAVDRTVKSMLSTLNTIEPSRLAARSESNWKDYAVDSTGTRVRVYSREDEVLDIVLGRLGFENQRSYYTYVRLSDEEDVYVADNFMKMSVSTDGPAYRNNTLARIPTDSIRTIAFNYPDTSFILEKNMSWEIEGEQTDSASVASYLRTFSYLSSSSRQFTDPVEDTKPDLSVVVATRNSEVTLKAFDQPGGWVVHSSSNPEEYFSDQTLFDKIFVGKTTFK